MSFVIIVIELLHKTIPYEKTKLFPEKPSFKCFGNS